MDVLLIFTIIAVISFFCVGYQYNELKTKYENLLKNQKDNGSKANTALNKEDQKLQSLLSRQSEEIKKLTDEKNKAIQERNLLKIQNDIKTKTELNQKYQECQSLLSQQSEEIKKLTDEKNKIIQNEKNLQSRYKNDLDSNYAKLFDATLNPSILSEYMSDSMTYSHIQLIPSNRKSRFWNFISDESGDHPHTITKMEITAFISSGDNNTYQTTLNQCSCKDFKINLRGLTPCKHMYFLAYKLAKANDIPFDKIVKEAASVSKELRDLEHQKKHLENEKKTLQSQKQSFPYTAKIISDYYADMCLSCADELRNKKQPAIKAADKVSEYAEMLREWCRRAKLAEHRLSFLQYIFPWLEEFDDIPPADAYHATLHVDNEASGYDHYKNWLSPEEYEKLTSTERNQRALDRYINRTKSNWEAGIEYERYIGYLYEKDGFKVSYVGAIKGMEDMGRDLIAKNGDITYIVQCKRWSKEKTIHEKHIFQLYGTVVLYKIEHPGETVQSVFITTTTLSETADLVAKYLGVIVYSEKDMDSYPLIKCNIGKDGSKIYHLPFDLQYDTVVISHERGEFYTETVAEAESRGFRHAYRWNS